MTTLDYSKLDQGENAQSSFYPRRNWTATPPGAQDHTIQVDESVSLSCRFFRAGSEAAGVADPTILFFYGNGETAPDYDDIAPIYNQIGVNFFVADYRGYGRSGGSPAFSTMLSDAVKVLESLKDILREAGISGKLFVMGRSMGRHAAFELAAGRDKDNGIAGVIIESGRPTLGQFTNGLESQEAEGFQAAYREKVSSITIPVLVIHGEVDSLAPVAEAQAMYQGIRSNDKRLLTIPGAGHNDLLHRGIDEYFTAVRDFCHPSG